MATMIEEMIFTVTGTSLLAGVWRAHTQLSAAVMRQPEPAPSRGVYPSVSVVHPIRGLDVGVEANIEAAFDLDYPAAVDHIFVFDDANEPALPLVEAVIARRSATGEHVAARVVIAGAPPADRTGKLNAMIVADALADGELLAVCDSDTRPAPEALRELVDALLGTPNAGSAFAPVLVPEARTAGDVGYALMLNALYGPEAASTAARAHELPFIMGQFMVFRRDALAAAGGLEASAGQLVDDMHIGAQLSRAGYHNVVASYRLPIIQYGMGLVEFARTYRRWIIFSRSGLPSWEFKWPAWLRGIEFWGALTLIPIAVGTGHALGAIAPAATVVAATYSLVALNRAFGGARIAPRHLWVPFALLLLAPFAYLSSFLSPRVTWRGRAYELDAGGRLATPTTAS